MPWTKPIPYNLAGTENSFSFMDMPDGVTGLPLDLHPGAFGVQRQFHVHEGVDLYVPEGCPVYAVEAGEVVVVMPFTGPKAGFPWWHDTDAVFIEGPSGVVVYGEISTTLRAGNKVAAGAHVGAVKTVLRKNKGRPMSMLHLELHARGSRAQKIWIERDNRPEGLLDPTPFLLGLVVC